MQRREQPSFGVEEHRERHMGDWCDLFFPLDPSPCMPARPCAVEHAQHLQDMTQIRRWT